MLSPPRRDVGSQLTSGLRDSVTGSACAVRTVRARYIGQEVTPRIPVEHIIARGIGIGHTITRITKQRESRQAGTELVSTLPDATGPPLHLVSAGANRHDAPLLEPPLAGLETFGPLPADITAHLDRGYANSFTGTL